MAVNYLILAAQVSCYADLTGADSIMDFIDYVKWKFMVGMLDEMSSASG